MPRGGRRTGKPGAQYSNRSDLQAAPRQLPVTTAPGQTYGEAGAQADAQRVVPMASGPQPLDVQTAAQQFQPPPVVGIGEPSQNPNEPLTTGMGAGVGPAVPTQQMQPNPTLKAVALLNALGDDVSPDTKAIRDVLNAAQANQAAP